MPEFKVVKYLLEHCELMTIATADETGKPWATPVAFCFDKSINFYWVSSKDAYHSQNIKRRPEVAIAVFGESENGETDGAYFDCIADEMTDPQEISEVMDLRSKREEQEKFQVKSVNDVLGDAVWRMYKATPVAAWQRGDAVVDGQAITVRDPIDLNELRKLLA